jgi:hypothetical protein
MGLRGPISTGLKSVDRVFQSVWNAINQIDGNVESVRQQMTRIEGMERGAMGELTINRTYDQVEVDGKAYGRARVWLLGRADRVSKIEYRMSVARNLSFLDPWAPMTRYASVEPYTFGYYQEDVLLDQAKQRNSVIEWRALDALDNILASERHSFDPDINPDFTSIHLALGGITNGKYPVYLIYALDEDGLSIQYGMPDVQLIEDLPVPDALFTTVYPSPYSNGLHIADLDPEATLYVVARGCENADGTGKKGTHPFRGRITAPVVPDEATIPDGSVEGAKLVEAAQRYSTTLAFRPDATLIQTRLRWDAAQISFVGGATYNLDAGYYDLPDSGLKVYVYFDGGVSSTQLQFTTNYAQAIASTGKRVFIGIARAGATANDYLFYTTGIEPIVSPALLYAASLQALFARIDDLTIKDKLFLGDAGELLNGAVDFTHGVGVYMSYNGGNPLFRVGDPDGQYLAWNGTELTVSGTINIVAGSGYANLTDRPTGLQDLDPTASTKLSGIQANATYGAVWGTNVSNIPARFLEAPNGSGLFLTPTHMGFYNGGTWKTYMDDSGNFYLTGTGQHGLTWNAGTNTLTVTGNIVIKGGSGWALLSDKPTSLADISAAESTKLAGIEAGATAGATWGVNMIPPPRFVDGTPAVAGLYATSSYFGYWNAGWKAYIGSNGNFALSGSGGHGLSWDGSTLDIAGVINAYGGAFRSTEDAGYWVDIQGKSIMVHGSGVPPFTGSLAIGPNSLEIASPGGSVLINTGGIQFNGTSPILAGGAGGITIGGSTIWHSGNFNPANYAASSHNHAWAQIVSGVPVYCLRWPAWSEVTDKPTEFTPAAHNHDSLYYTKTQIDGFTFARQGQINGATTFTSLTIYNGGAVLHAGNTYWGTPSGGTCQLTVNGTTRTVTLAS